MANNSNTSFDLSWLTNFMSSLPATPKRRKNLIEIAGYPHWENVNSNFLAFYLDENEEHGLSRLFIESLLDLIEKHKEGFDRENFNGPYTVEREVQVATGNRIDLLIKESSNIQEEEDANDSEDDHLTGDEWGIIIENKLNAPLYNDLEAYWQGVTGNNKIGVVLSLKSYQGNDQLNNEKFNFISLTHREFVNQVKANLPDFYMDADDRHLLFLKEYIGQIESFYSNEANKPAMNKKLQQFFEYSDQIKRLKSIEGELLKFLFRTITEKMGHEGFLPRNRKASNAMHFYPDESFFEDSEIAKKFRFWVNIDRLKYTNNFKAFFELHGNKNTIYGTQLKDRLADIFTENVLRDDGGREGGTYIHIFQINFNLEKSYSEKGFEEQLSEGLDRYFFKHENQFLDTTLKELKAIIEENN